MLVAMIYCFIHSAFEQCKAIKHMFVPKMHLSQYDYNFWNQCVFESSCVDEWKQQLNLMVPFFEKIKL